MTPEKRVAGYFADKADEATAIMLIRAAVQAEREACALLACYWCRHTDRNPLIGGLGHDITAAWAKVDPKQKRVYANCSAQAIRARTAQDEGK